MCVCVCVCMCVCVCVCVYMSVCEWIGVAILDIGGGTSDLAVFYEGILKHTGNRDSREVPQKPEEKKE